MRASAVVNCQRITTPRSFLRRSHSDTSWPNTQERVGRLLDGVPAHEAAMIAWKNAADLFSLDVPTDIIDDPERF